MNSKLWLVISGVVLASLSSSMAAPPKPVPIGDKTPSKVFEYAKSQLGKKVGNGRATDFVRAALAAAGADPGDPTNEFPVWGERRSSVLLLPGQIIQFEQCSFRTADGKAWRYTHHTAIVKNMVANKVGSKSRTVVLLHQGEDRDLTKSVVHETELDLAALTHGEWRNYSPIPGQKRPSPPPASPVNPAPTKPPPVNPPPVKPVPVGPSPKPIPKPSSSRQIVCTPIDWVQVNLNAGLGWFGRDVPGIRESPETKDSLTAMLKKYGFETQFRGVKGTGGSVKLQLFARMTKETRTANNSNTERLDREVKAIADMVYGGQKAVNKKVYMLVPK